MLRKPLSALDNKSATKSLYGINSKYGGFIQLIFDVYFFLISIGAIPFKLMNYEKFGERTFTSLGIFISMILYFLLTVGLTTIIGMLLFSDYKEPSGWIGFIVFISWIFNFSNIYFLRFFQLSLKEIKMKFVGFNKPYSKHSYYRGDLREGIFSDFSGEELLGFSSDNEDYVRMIFLPINEILKTLLFTLLAVVFGLLIYWIDNPTLSLIVLFPVLSVFFTSFAMILSSIFNMIEEYIVFKRIRSAVLDSIDAEQDIKLINSKRTLLQNGKNQKIEGNTLNQSSGEHFPTVKIY